jgi:hypothetical protein
MAKWYEAARTVGILAFGSLITDPGSEVVAVRGDSINVDTPFNVEFGRSSKTRDGAPTLVPVEKGGAKVKAVVFVLAPSVSEREAADMLWRRETRKVGSGRRYDPPAHPRANSVLVKKLTGFSGLDVSYLIAVKESNIRTPLMPEYEREILARTASTNLKEALRKIRPAGSKTFDK